jgi:hypothetical protein
MLRHGITNQINDIVLMNNFIQLWSFVEVSTSFYGLYKRYSGEC